MLKNKMAISLFGAILLSTTSYALDKTITFKNQRGSTLEITFLADNQLIGYFTTAVASKSCPRSHWHKATDSGIYGR